MARSVFLLASILALLLASSSGVSAAVVEHYLHIENTVVERLCHKQVITVGNGSIPGPEMAVREGDTLVVHVVNKSPYDITIHWHGVFQLFSAWADGTEYTTQCPIRPGNTYTHKFKVTKQEGTLFWHAHVKWLRATVYGAIIIRPRFGLPYPFFPKPYAEYPIVLGEWWNANILDVEDESLATGGASNISDAYTINGQPGDLYPCSSAGTYKLKVVRGKTYLLRIINAALNNHLFFKIADHKMKVVNIDASYTTPMVTDVVTISPGQTVDVLVTANQPPSSYYMAARPYISTEDLAFDNTTTTAIFMYENASPSEPKMPVLPDFRDTTTAHKFYSSLTSLVGGPHWTPVPLRVDESMFISTGLGLLPCGANATCAGILGQRMAATMNNVSFVFPSKLSMLEAFYHNVSGVYTTDFPDQPPKAFDYTNPNNQLNTSIVMTAQSTKVKKLRFNSVVQMVLQNTVLLGVDNHPIHLHGFDLYVLAQGFGNYDPAKDTKNFNLINPQVRNTIGVPVGGWAVVRFRANNPGIWLMHCHLDVHVPWGQSMAFEVENGPTPFTKLPPPPADLPKC
ncbi:laccase-7-like [Diospyros lotus]|uniref:laccase-7-like n=1 Tax=Diospyros lotus TaxID=55363 RepID=UPI0022526852|nr:laccase-7-like [Diospyros lotus]